MVLQLRDNPQAAGGVALWCGTCLASTASTDGEVAYSEVAAKRPGTVWSCLERGKAMDGNRSNSWGAKETETRRTKRSAMRANLSQVSVPQQEGSQPGQKAIASERRGNGRS